MPMLTVYVDEKAVEIDIHEGDNLCSLASELEKYGVNPGYPTVYLEGREIGPFNKLDFTKTYKFGK